MTKPWTKTLSLVLTLAFAMAAVMGATPAPASAADRDTTDRAADRAAAEWEAFVRTLASQDTPSFTVVAVLDDGTEVELDPDAPMPDWTWVNHTLHVNVYLNSQETSEAKFHAYWGIACGAFAAIPIVGAVLAGACALRVAHLIGYAQLYDSRGECLGMHVPKPVPHAFWVFSHTGARC